MMDEIVKKALLKWPDVPDCFNWLALDGRGRWRIGHERQTITHAPTIAFIGRNYVNDSEGRWLFQNGPQRVFVELEYTPFVWRITARDNQWILADQIGSAAPSPQAVFIDDEGRFLLLSDGRAGVLHDHDSHMLLDALRNSSGMRLSDEQIVDAISEQDTAGDPRLFLAWPQGAGLIPVEHIKRDAVARRFSFDPDPGAVKTAHQPGTGR